MYGYLSSVDTVMQSVTAQCLFDPSFKSLIRTHTNISLCTSFYDAVRTATSRLFSNENYSVAVITEGSAKSLSSAARQTHLVTLLNPSLFSLQACNCHHDTSIVRHQYWSHTNDCTWELIQPEGMDDGLWSLTSYCDLLSHVSCKKRDDFLFISMVLEWLRWTDECYDLVQLPLKDNNLGGVFWVSSVVFTLKQTAWLQINSREKSGSGVRNKRRIKHNDNITED